MASQEVTERKRVPRGSLITRWHWQQCLFRLLVFGDKFGSVRNDVFSVLLWGRVYTFAILGNKFRQCFLHRHFKIHWRRLLTRCIAFICYWSSGDIEWGSIFFFQLEDLIRSSPIAKSKASASLFIIS